MDESSGFFWVCNTVSAALAIWCLVIADRYRELREKGKLPDINPPPLLSPYGRIGRARFFGYLVVASVAGAATVTVLRISAEALDASRGLLFGALPVVPFVVLAAAKRFRDAGQSPYWSIACAVPAIGLLATLFCIFAPARSAETAPSIRTGLSQSTLPTSTLVSAPAPDWLTKPARRATTSLSGPASAIEDAVSPAPVPAQYDGSATNAGEAAQASPTPNADQEEERWAAALAELDEKRHRPGLWARSFAEAMGDENKARALYLAYRVQQMAGPSRTDGLTA